MIVDDMYDILYTSSMSCVFLHNDHKTGSVLMTCRGGAGVTLSVCHFFCPFWTHLHILTAGSIPDRHLFVFMWKNDCDFGETGKRRRRRLVNEDVVEMWSTTFAKAALAKFGPRFSTRALWKPAIVIFWSFFLKLT